MRYGYARVSTNDQDLTLQIDALEKADCSVIRKEKVSGTKLDNREELNTLLDFIREGDELVVTRIDGLARSLRDLQNIVHLLNKKGVNLVATDQPIDTSTSAGKAFLDMLGVFAEFETNLRRERQAEGIAKAKAKGVYENRKRKKKVSDKRIFELVTEGLNKSEIAEALGVSRMTVHRCLSKVA